MVDPFAITKYDRNISELEEMLLFCVLVAGKPAKRTSSQLDLFLGHHRQEPFAYVRSLIESGKLRSQLQFFGFGQYSRIEKCFRQLVWSEIDLQKCSLEELDQIPGIGPKTAAFFITHSRYPKSIDEDAVILDTHSMKHIAKNAEWLIEVGHLSVGKKIPKNTPSGKGYQIFSNCFRALIRRDDPQSTLADYDLKIWKSYAKV
jgi:hypothetical protein